MKQHITESAKSLITIIGTEYMSARRRVDMGYVSSDRMLGMLLELLNRLAIDNLSLRKFLDDVGHIPENEDIDMHLPWSKDPRDPRDIEALGKRDKKRPGAISVRHFGNRGNKLTGL